MNPLQKSIIATLCYSDIFDYPLTQKEITEKLINDKPVKKTILIPIIEKLHQDGFICQTGSYFHLPHRSRIIKLRIARLALSTKKQQQAKHIADRIMSLPYVRAVFLTGAVAVGNASAPDDIDIMVVSASHSLWTCRLFVNGWLDAFHFRRHPRDKQVRDKICPNLFLAENALRIAQSQRNLYSAHEVIQAKLLAGPDQFQNIFLSQNAWIKTYLSNVTIPTDNTLEPSPVQAPVKGEAVARRLQEMYMKSKKTREITSAEVAFFHPRDTATVIQTKFEQRMRQYTR